MKKLHEDFVIFKNDEDEYFLTQNEDADGEQYKEVKLRVKKPNHEQQRQSNMVYSKSVSEYIKNGVMPQLKIEQLVKKQGIWDSDMEKEEKELYRVIGDATKILSRGNIKKSEAVKWAKKGIDAKFKLITLGSQRNAMYNNSAENLSKTDQFNYLVSECTVYSDSGNKFFKDTEDYLRQDSLGSVVPWKAGEQLGKLLYNMDEDFREGWIEYKFLIKQKLVNDKLQFVNEDGKLVDDNGDLVDDIKEEFPLEPMFLPD